MNKSTGDGLGEAKRIPGELGGSKLALASRENWIVPGARAWLADSTDESRISGPESRWLGNRAPIWALCSDRHSGSEMKLSPQAWE